LLLFALLLCSAALAFQRFSSLLATGLRTFLIFL
jgi:hypothetical protein